MSSSARAVARIEKALREHLPESDGWRFKVGSDVIEVVDAQLRTRGSAYPDTRTWCRWRTPSQQPMDSDIAYRGEGWAEMVGYHLAREILRSPYV